MDDTPTPNNEIDSTGQSTEQLKQKRFISIMAFVLIGLVVLVTVTYFVQKNREGGLPPVALPVEADFRSSLQDSVSGNNPVPLQDFFAEKVQNNEVDDEAKSAIYWITHRYFDNGGNIYEIYNFIEARPEIAFLKAAENIYPSIFNLIKENKMPNYSLESLLALLAYYEVIDSNGYGDVALWGLAANKHAEVGDRAGRSEIKEPEYYTETGETNPLIFSDKMINQSLHFVEKTKEFLILNTQQSGSLTDLYSLSIIPDDLLVGLNQYGAALENLKKVGVAVYSPYTPSELYEFNHELSETKVPRLYFFTNYLYAASLVASGEANTENVSVALGRMVDYTEQTSPAEWSGSVTRVTNSRVARESGMYSYDTVKNLAALNPRFKNWLMTQGWSATDFN